MDVLRCHEHHAIHGREGGVAGEIMVKALKKLCRLIAGYISRQVWVIDPPQHILLCTKPCSDRENDLVLEVGRIAVS